MVKENGNCWAAKMGPQAWYADRHLPRLPYEPKPIVKRVKPVNGAKPIVDLGRVNVWPSGKVGR